MRTPPPPLECPDGWHAAPPDFVGVGAQRSGTTWWYGLLAAHPDFRRVEGSPKELHFFDRCLDRGLAADDADVYAQHFARPPGTISGEWTPRYMFDFWTPAYLKACAPDARLLVLLRDPVARFRSGMATHAASRGARGRPSDPLAPGVHLARGLYWNQLQGVLRHFPRERLLVLQYERCVAAPGPELERTCRFLGIAPFDGAISTAPVNASDGAAELPAEVVSQLRDALVEDVRRLAADFPEIDLELWPAAAGAIS